VEELSAKAGDIFDPSFHEAVAGTGKNQKVSRVLRKGYSVNGRVIRPVQVEVK
jgi:molecular chaperone GrpE (heat shock protein)